MKAMISGCVALAALAACGAAQAADPSMRGPAPYEWNGPFFGMSIAVGLGQSRHSAAAGDLTPSFDVTGGLYGLALGYNWQAGKLLYGIETDFSVATVRGTSGYLGAPAGLPQRLQNVGSRPTAAALDMCVTAGCSISLAAAPRPIGKSLPPSLAQALPPKSGHTMGMDRRRWRGSRTRASLTVKAEYLSVISVTWVTSIRRHRDTSIVPGEFPFTSMFSASVSTINFPGHTRACPQLSRMIAATN